MPTELFKVMEVLSGFGSDFWHFGAIFGLRRPVASGKIFSIFENILENVEGPERI